MEIRVMGSGCANCKALHQTMLQAAKSLGLSEDCVIYDNDIQKIIEMNILRLPAVVIDGKIASQGKKYSLAEAQDLIKSYLPQI